MTTFTADQLRDIIMLSHNRYHECRVRDGLEAESARHMVELNKAAVAMLREAIAQPNGYFLTLEGNGGHVKATKTAAKNGTGTSYEGIGYRKAAVAGGFKFYRPPYDDAGTAPAPVPEKTAADYVKEWQTWLGTEPDGDPGPDTLTCAIARLLALLLLCVLCASWGWCAGMAYAIRPRDYSSYNSTQMSWIVEGIWERATSEADRAAKIQRGKMADKGLLTD